MEFIWSIVLLCLIISLLTGLFSEFTSLIHLGIFSNIKCL